MLWLVSGSTATVARHPHLGVLVVPAEKRKAAIPVGRPWAMDNSAFTRFDPVRFMDMLRWARVPAGSVGRDGRKRCDGSTSAGCLFVTAPDVVADAVATRDLWPVWAPIIRAHGFPVAYVVQDGTPGVPVPWDECDAVFIGGSTAFKYSAAAQTTVAYARARGKWAHMGRVNTRERYRFAADIGIQSCDGTGFSRFGEEYVRRTRRWMRQGRLML